MESMGSTARDVLQYGALGLLAAMVVGAGFLSMRAGRAIWGTVDAYFAGLLGEFRRSNDITAGLHGKIDTHSIAVAGEHEKTRAHVTASHAAIIREVHARGELTEQVVRERVSAMTGEVKEELSRTGEHAAVAPPDLPPRRAPTNPRMPAAR